MRRFRIAMPLAAAACAAWLLTPRALPAQSPYVVRAPQLAWRTAETAHWRVHYPASAQPLADCLLPRLEPMYRAVSALVGYSTTPKVTLVIEDAAGGDGAFASANARAPVIVLQAQPSTPRSGGWSDCATGRMTHELTHILQLSRPYGAAHPWWMRTFMRLLPAEPGPVVLRRKAWLREAYAEHVEGRLVATGAPYTSVRADVVRQLALGDRLPSYARLSDSYEGRYLVGSAFLDWLVAHHPTDGEAALRTLWERMAAADWKGERVELARLFGAAPESLYATFARDTRARAALVRERITTAGLVRGARVRSAGWTDAIAASRDGARVAAVVGTPVLRLHIWNARDSTTRPDVVPIPTGQSPSAPRFLPDGRVLLVHWERTDAGLWRPDLFEWTPSTSRMRRITQGAGVRDADPLPDGRSAIGARCSYGVCDLVQIRLADGEVTTLVSGSADRAFHRPRVSPDGRLVAATVQSGATARVVLVDLATRVVRDAGPADGVWRYEPAFLPDGRLVVVSEASGVPNLELVDPRNGSTRALTRLLAPALAPEPDPAGDGVYFLRTSDQGVELRRIALADTLLADTLPAGARSVNVRDSALAPAAPVPIPDRAPAAFVPEPIGNPRAYGFGPRFTSVLPASAVNADGATGSVLLWNSDIVGRASMMVDGTVGHGAAWRGAGASIALRTFAMPVAGRVSFGRTDELQHASVSVQGTRELGPWSRTQRISVGVAAGRAGRAGRAGLRGGSEDGDAPAARALIAGGYGLSLWQVGDRYAREAVDLSATGGSTDGRRWTRAVATARLETGRTNIATWLQLSVTAAATSSHAPWFERVLVGGAATPGSDDLALAHAIPQPLLGVGAISAERLLLAHAAGPRIGPVVPFAWLGVPDGRRGQGIVGLMRELVDEPRRNWRVPGARLAGSIGWLTGERRGVRGSLSLTFVQ